MTISTQKSNYASFAERIRQAETPAQFDRLEQSLDRLYNAGVFTVSQFARLDGILIDARIAAED